MALFLFWIVPVVLVLLWVISLLRRQRHYTVDGWNAVHQTQFNGNRGALLVPVIFLVIVIVAIVSAAT